MQALLRSKGHWRFATGEIYKSVEVINADSSNMGIVQQLEIEEKLGCDLLRYVG
jgi:hypothetical protein